jgi:hypothetical protein
MKAALGIGFCPETHAYAQSTESSCTFAHYDHFTVHFIIHMRSTEPISNRLDTEEQQVHRRSKVEKVVFLQGIPLI